MSVVAIYQPDIIYGTNITTYYTLIWETNLITVAIAARLDDWLK